MWKYRGQERPPFAEEAGVGQESVWDYPRPPAVQRCEHLVEVEANGRMLARSTETYRVMETASPPGFYIPPTAIRWDKLTPGGGSSFCEWKGEAKYWQLASHPATPPVGWSYPNPTAPYEMLRGYVSFYPGRVVCRVAGERVQPQPGSFYGGWITAGVVGPFKGETGTANW